jgi:hypothetical protein
LLKTKFPVMVVPLSLLFGPPPLNVAVPVTVKGMLIVPVEVMFTTVGALPLLLPTLALKTTLSLLAGRADACVVKASLVHQLPSVAQSLSTAALKYKVAIYFLLINF